MPHPSPWAFDVSVPAWNQVDVGVEHGLSRRLTTIPTNVESFDGSILLRNLATLSDEETVNRGSLFFGQVKVSGGMSLGNHKCVQFSHRKAVAEG